MQKYVELLSKNLRFNSMEIVDNIIIIDVDSTTSTCSCPVCGQLSHKRNSGYSKTINDLPIDNMRVKFKFVNRIFECENKECKKKYFSETFDFIEPRAHKTNRLAKFIETNSLNISSTYASKVMLVSGIKVCKSTLCNLKKKNQ